MSFIFLASRNLGFDTKMAYSSNIGLQLKKNSPNMFSNTSLDFISNMGVTDHKRYDR